MMPRALRLAMLVPILPVAAIAAAAPATSTIASAQACGTWAEVSAHDPGSYSQLSGLAITAPNDIWTIGGGGFQHDAGSGFTLVPEPSLHGLGGGPQAISADASNDVWAVGQQFPHGQYPPPFSTLVEHFDGASWKVVASPNPDARANMLGGVVALARSNVWAVGESANRALIEHFDGGSWSAVPNPAPAGRSGLFAVAAAGPTNIKALGDTIDANGTVHSMVMSFNGSAWSLDAVPDTTGTLATITSVPNTSHYVVTGMSTSQSTYVFDGSRWSSRPAPAMPFNGWISSVTAISDTNVWAVGSYFDSQFVTQPFALHYNGSGWTSSFSTFSLSGRTSGLTTVGHGGAAVYVAGNDSPTSVSDGEVFAATRTC
jgi:hypothetical protein